MSDMGARVKKMMISAVSFISSSVMAEMVNALLNKPLIQIFEVS